MWEKTVKRWQTWRCWMGFCCVIVAITCMLNTLIPVESHRHRQCRMNIHIYIHVRWMMMMMTMMTMMMMMVNNCSLIGLLLNIYLVHDHDHFSNVVNPTDGFYKPRWNWGWLLIWFTTVCISYTQRHYYHHLDRWNRGTYYERVHLCNPSNSVVILLQNSDSDTHIHIAVYHCMASYHQPCTIFPFGAES